MMELIQSHLFEILATILMAIISFLGTTIKLKYDKYIDTKEKKEIVKLTVQYVEQVFKELHGKEKLEKAKEKAVEWLNEKGIKISETELEILIESSVNEFNKTMK